MYYTYILKNSLDNLPFYVGKGKDSRMYAHVNEALRPSYKFKRSVHYKILNILNNNGKIVYEKIMFQTEKEAFEEEKRLIALYGRKDNDTGILCNLTDGGEGAPLLSEAAIHQRAEKHRGSKRSEEAKSNMKQAQIRLAEEKRKKYNKGCSPETSQRMSQNRKGKPWSKKAREVLRNKPTAKSVLVYKKETGEFVGEWESISLCAKQLQCDPSAIWKICKGTWVTETPSGISAPYKSHKGYVFKFKDQVNPTP